MTHSDSTKILKDIIVISLYICVWYSTVSIYLKITDGNIDYNIILKNILLLFEYLCVEMHAYVGRHMTLHTCEKREDKHNGIILFLKLDVNSMLWTQVLRLSQEALYLLSHIPVLKNAFWSKVSTVKCGNVCVCSLVHSMWIQSSSNNFILYSL